MNKFYIQPQTTMLPHLSYDAICAGSGPSKPMINYYPIPIETEDEVGD